MKVSSFHIILEYWFLSNIIYIIKLKLFSDLLHFDYQTCKSLNGDLMATKTVWGQDSRVTHEADDGNRLYWVIGTESVIWGDDDVL